MKRRQRSMETTHECVQSSSKHELRRVDELPPYSSVCTRSFCPLLFYWWTVTVWWSGAIKIWVVTGKKTTWLRLRGSKEPETTPGQCCAVNQVSRTRWWDWDPFCKTVETGDVSAIFIYVRTSDKCVFHEAILWVHPTPSSECTWEPRMVIRGRWNKSTTQEVSETFKIKTLMYLN